MRRDGINSRIRTPLRRDLRSPISTPASCRFVWLGTHKLFDAFTFAFEKTEHGWFQAHAYRFDDDHVHVHRRDPRAASWRAAGIEQMSQEEGVAFCERLFARHLDGHKLISNATHLRGSASWIRFPRVICQRWVHWNTLDDGRRVPVVLMGDAAHTAHFSIGSGTKLALEDAIDLANAIGRAHGGIDGLPEALTHYEATRSVEVLKIQNAARNSTEWFENVERYADSLAPEQFAYSLLTRSQRISHENLRVRDAGYVADFEQWLAAQAGVTPETLQPAHRRSQHGLPPMFTPYRVQREHRRQAYRDGGGVCGVSKAPACGQPLLSPPHGDIARFSWGMRWLKWANCSGAQACPRSSRVLEPFRARALSASARAGRAAVPRAPWRWRGRCSSASSPFLRRCASPIGNRHPAPSA